MKKRLLFSVAMLSLFALVLCACDQLCIHLHFYDDDMVCKICGDKNAVTGDTDGNGDTDEKTFFVRFLDENGTLIAIQSVNSGKKIVQPENTVKDGYDFLGWFDNGVAWDFETGRVDKDLTLKAKWVTYVVYRLNGGTNSESNPTELYSDSEYPFTLQAPTKDDYVFMGWYADPELTIPVYTVSSFKYQVLYAAWKVDYEDTDKPWSTTNLIFRMTENSNNQELSSTCARYLAGDLSSVDDVSAIDRFVSDRNNAALEYANVSVTYQYHPDTPMYSWGQNIDLIDSEVRAKEPGRPDIYCNFVYDMVAVSLKGSFANLLSTTMYEDGHELAGLNYFEFADDRSLADTGEGYMMDYMRSLTLSKHKMYCLASDYFIDMMRAALVIPVNIGLLETFMQDGSYNAATGKGDFLADRVTDDKDNYSIEDFYQLVYDHEWNYENLAKFSEAIFSEGAEGDDVVDLRDTIGFALSTDSGLGAAGMLYSSSVTIIDRVYDVDKGDYIYSYPYTVQKGEGADVQFVKAEEGNHQELIDFCNNLNDLFRKKGVIAVSNNDTFDYAQTELQAIRKRFSTNNVLFGGVICLGSLEYHEYKAMNGQGGSGYGIAPIPLYRTNYIDANGQLRVDEYSTQIHNIGRIGAISYTTEKFAQCTAYLNYQSTHSTEILNKYYDYKLQYDVGGDEVKGNVEMLKYIRKNVRSSFDKAFEDALGRFYNATDDQSMKQQWHTMLKDNSYLFTGMADAYGSVAPVKAWRLYNLENSIYPTLPD